MNKGLGRADRLFRVVCLVFSLVMLLMSLICRVGIMDVEAELSRLGTEMKHAQKENEILIVRMENRISLSELERIATGVLGMHRPLAEQLYFDVIQ